MIATLIGISSGLLTILFISLLRQLDKKLMYGLILAGIGFLYVGFVWTDIQAAIINSAQAIVFIFLAYYGTKKATWILATGYLLHGCWDLVYSWIQAPELIPPQYDLFCSTLDFTIGIYILFAREKFKTPQPNPVYI